jgi:4-hydroxybenzoate polyprenyltransferase
MHAETSSMLTYVVKSMRPQQWYKNLLLFAGIVFSKHFSDFVLLGKVSMGFFIFCLLSSSLYLLNDIWDRRLDALHPKKKYRPIAQGLLPVSYAFIFSVFFASISLISSYFLGVYFFLSALLYLVVMVFYSWVLKNIEIIDVIIIGVGFVLRAIAGCLIVGVLISPWLILCTFLLALFLAFGKRRHELLSDRTYRQTLTHYSESLLDHFLSITSASIILSYSLYTFISQKNLALMLTIPFVVFGVFRFFYLIYSRDEVSANTELIFKDSAMVANLLLWGASVIFILYLS